MAKLIALPILFPWPTDGVWRRESPNEVSPSPEYRGQSQRHAPLPKWSSARRRRIRAATERRAPVSRLEQTDVRERHGTWTAHAARRVRGNYERDREPISFMEYFMKRVTSIWNMNHFFFFFLSLFQIQDGRWHQSRFFFHTQDSRQLPIVDIQEFPTSRSNSSERYIEISPVCFLWHRRHRPVDLVFFYTWTAKIQGCYKKTPNVFLPKRVRDRHVGATSSPVSNRRQTRMEELDIGGKSSAKKAQRMRA